MKSMYGVFTPYNQDQEGNPRIYGNGRIIGDFYATLAEAEAALENEDAVAGSVVRKMVYTSTAVPFVAVEEQGKQKVLGYFPDFNDALGVSKLPGIAKHGESVAVYALPDPKTSGMVFHSVDGFKAFYDQSKWVSPKPLSVVANGSAMANMFKIFN